MSYGTVVVNDASDASGVRPVKNSTFVVDLMYEGSTNTYRDGETRPVGAKVDYRKQHTRLAPDKGLMASVKSFVAQFAGCDEAHKLRKRMIALGRIRKTISGEPFRFPVGCES